LVSRTAGLDPEQMFTLYEKCVLPAVLAHKEKRKYEIPFMISPDLLGLQIFIKNGEDGLLFVATGVPISLSANDSLKRLQTAADEMQRLWCLFFPSTKSTVVDADELDEMLGPILDSIIIGHNESQFWSALSPKLARYLTNGYKGQSGSPCHCLYQFFAWLLTVVLMVIPCCWLWLCGTVFPRYGRIQREEKANAVRLSASYITVQPPVETKISLPIDVFMLTPEEERAIECSLGDGGLMDDDCLQASGRGGGGGAAGEPGLDSIMHEAINSIMERGERLESLAAPSLDNEVLAVFQQKKSRSGNLDLKPTLSISSRSAAPERKSSRPADASTIRSKKSCHVT